MPLPLLPLKGFAETLPGAGAFLSTKHLSPFHSPAVQSSLLQTHISGSLVSQCVKRMNLRLANSVSPLRTQAVSEVLDCWEGSGWILFPLAGAPDYSC